LLLEVNGFYCRKLILFGIVHYISRFFVGRHNFRNPIVKKVLLGQSNCKVKKELVKVLPSLLISFQCSFVHIILSLIRPSSDYIFICISSPAVSKES